MCPISSVLKNILHNFKTFMIVNHGNPEYVPRVFEESATFSSGQFNWRDFYKRCLAVMNEMHIDQNIADNQALHSNGSRLLRGKKKATEAELRFAMERCLQYKRKKTNAT